MGGTNDTLPPTFQKVLGKYPLPQRRPWCIVFKIMSNRIHPLPVLYVTARVTRGALACASSQGGATMLGATIVSMERS